MITLGTANTVSNSFLFLKLSDGSFAVAKCFFFLYMYFSFQNPLGTTNTVANRFLFVKHSDGLFEVAKCFFLYMYFFFQNPLGTTNTVANRFLFVKRSDGSFAAANSLISDGLPVTIKVFKILCAESYENI